MGARYSRTIPEGDCPEVIPAGSYRVFLQVGRGRSTGKHYRGKGDGFHLAKYCMPLRGAKSFCDGQWKTVLWEANEGMVRINGNRKEVHISWLFAGQRPNGGH